MPAPQDRLADMRRLLRPGGTLFLVDIGRTLNVADWRSYFFSHLSKEVGIAKAIWILWKGREMPVSKSSNKNPRTEAIATF
jgi:SAM-dependent methyltransferase